MALSNLYFKILLGKRQAAIALTLFLAIWIAAIFLLSQTYSLLQITHLNQSQAESFKIESETAEKLLLLDPVDTFLIVLHARLIAHQHNAESSSLLINFYSLPNFFLNAILITIGAPRAPPFSHLI